LRLREAPLAAAPRVLSAECVARGIHHHPIEPSSEPALPAPGREPRGQGDADILGEVRGLIRIAEHPGADPKDAVVVALQKRRERLPVTRRGAPRERAVPLFTLFHAEESSALATLLSIWTHAASESLARQLPPPRARAVTSS